MESESKKDSRFSDGTRPQDPSSLVPTSNKVSEHSVRAKDEATRQRCEDWRAVREGAKALERSAVKLPNDLPANGSRRNYIY